jgi:hypothetical protein
MRAISPAIFLAAVLAAGCTPRALPLGPEHPARADAPTGRLAGPPPALRPVASSSAPPAKPSPPPAHDHGSHR